MVRERLRPRVDVAHWSPNYSSRGGARPTLIVVHATAGHNRPGVLDLQGLGSWFSNPSVPPADRVSAHVATDNEGHSARYVADASKAWHCAGYNRVALGVEQVIPGDGHELTEDLYRETARWIALWSHLHHIPIREGAVNGPYVTRAGVLRHSQLGVIGGGHSDPGPYDEHHLLELARYYLRRAY
jgi:hypothetical protein